MARNYVRDPDFTLPLPPGSFHLAGVNAQVAKGWFVGAGQGGVCDVSFPPMSIANLAQWGFKRNPFQFLELNWSQAPTAGDNDAAHGMPGLHWTFLEHIMGANASDLMGKSIQYYFRSVCFSGSPNVSIIPLIEVNRKNGDYTLYPQPPVSITTGGWGTGQGTFTIPQFAASDTVDNTFYVAFSLAISGLCAPHLALADFALWRGNVTVDEVESRPYELEALIA